MIKYFKRMIKNQQMDKFKAQMNSQSQHDTNEERNISPRQHCRGRQTSKKGKVVAQTGSIGSDLSGKAIVVESKTSSVPHHSSSQEIIP